MQAYKAAFSAALEAEFSEERQLADERLNTWSDKRLQASQVLHAPLYTSTCCSQGCCLRVQAAWVLVTGVHLF